MTTKPRVTTLNQDWTKKTKYQISKFKFQIAVLLGLHLAASAWALDLTPHGFIDTRVGIRTQEDPNEGDTSLGETRLQWDWMQYVGPATLQIRSDFLYDWVRDDADIDLEEGTGWLDLREANILFSPLRSMDVKAGRQILTWGKGDLLFINDMFPKDWQSFFIGRDEEYLKAPSDAVLISMFPSFINIDVAYMPRFDADRFITGERLSYWNPATGARSGEEAIAEPDIPNDWFSDDEVSVRLSRNISGYELAAYGYSGFWKSPAGMNGQTGQAIFPELNVYGASLCGQLGVGILNLEAGYYDSIDDSDGDDPLVRNSETRALVGYEQEVARDLSASVQYYIEHIMDYDGYEAGLMEGQKGSDEDRHVITLRVTQQLMSQNLRLSFFTYYSPSDEDGYIRPNISYKMTDEWLITVGGNVFFGEDDHTFFGQFENNNNVYTGVRYSF